VALPDGGFAEGATQAGLGPSSGPVIVPRRLLFDRSVLSSHPADHLQVREALYVGDTVFWRCSLPSLVEFRCVHSAPQQQQQHLAGDPGQRRWQGVADPPARGQWGFRRPVTSRCSLPPP